jgi:hypothetical protein
MNIPIESLLEYKYFIGPFDLQSNGLTQLWWLGDRNLQLKITAQNKAKFMQDNVDEMNIMSYNLRFESKNEK